MPKYMRIQGISNHNYIQYLHGNDRCSIKHQHKYNDRLETFSTQKKYAPHLYTIPHRTSQCRKKRAKYFTTSVRIIAERTCQYLLLWAWPVLRDIERQSISRSSMSRVPSSPRRPKRLKVSCGVSPFALVVRSAGSRCPRLYCKLSSG